MKNLLFALLGILCSAYVDAQKVSYVKLYGDTFVMNMIKGWEPCTGEILAKAPARRKLSGYETTCFTRVSTSLSNKADAGLSIMITEYLGCKSWKEIQKRDSLNFVNDRKRYHTVTWSMLKSGKAKQTVELVLRPVKHPETGKEECVRLKRWYIQGWGNTYVFEFASSEALAWNKWLPEMDVLINSLQKN